MKQTKSNKFLTIPKNLIYALIVVSIGWIWSVGVTLSPDGISNVLLFLFGVIHIGISSIQALLVFWTLNQSDSADKRRKKIIIHVTAFLLWTIIIFIRYGIMTLFQDPAYFLSTIIKNILALYKSPDEWEPTKSILIILKMHALFIVYYLGIDLYRGAFKAIPASNNKIRSDKLSQ